jgi:hypothetical protein
MTTKKITIEFEIRSDVGHEEFINNIPKHWYKAKLIDAIPESKDELQKELDEAKGLLKDCLYFRGTQSERIIKIQNFLNEQ